MLLEDILNPIDCQRWAEMKKPVLNLRDGIVGLVMAMNRNLEAVFFLKQ
jgi:hypothetical protein